MQILQRNDILTSDEDIYLFNMRDTQNTEHSKQYSGHK